MQLGGEGREGGGDQPLDRGVRRQATRYLNNVKLPGEERRRREYQRQMFAL